MERLPVKFFAKRDVDSLKTEAGGGDELPKWILEPDALSEKSILFVHTFDQFSLNIEKREKGNSLLPLIIKAKFSDDATAKTHRKEVCQLFRTSAENNIIGLAESDELIIKLSSSKDISIIKSRLSNVDKYKYALSCLEEINYFKPYINRNNNESGSLKIKLIDYQKYEQNLAIRTYFENYLRKSGVVFSKTKYSPENYIYKIRSDEESRLDELVESDSFEAVFSIEPMPKYTIGLDMISDDIDVDIILPNDAENYITVGVLDSGINNIPHLSPWLRDDKWSTYPESVIDRSHGTFVSGVIIYGDILENQTWVGTHGIRVLDACVIPDTNRESIEEDELVSNIREAIKKHHKDVKIWNLSISIFKEVEEFAFSDFAVALDSLQDEYNVMICKSAGNCKNFVKGFPKGKINHGADSVRSIVVGSIAHTRSKNDLAQIGNPSPFTRTGRGPSYIIKPEVVHYGGNAGLDENGKLVTSGVKSFGLDGNICKSVGTSFSTPRITSLVGGIYQEMSEEFDPLLLKGLVIHSAKYCEDLTIPDAERINQLGFGMPNSIRNILYNSSNEITLILRDELSKGQYIDIMDFPMPNCLIENGYFTGQIILTIVYNPILDPSQRAEYCQSNLDVKFGTYDNKKDRDTSRRNIINPIGKDGTQNLLLEQCYSKRKMRDSSDEFALKERLLIQYGDKYYPVKKYAVNLEEMSDTNKNKYLTDDKHWFLTVKGLFRENVETIAQMEDVNLSQEFCLIITIRDPKGSRPVYNEATQKLAEHNFWHSNVKLKSEIEVRQ